MKRILFNVEKQAELNKNISRRIRDKFSSISTIEDIITEDAFYDMINDKILTVVRELPLWCLFELRLMGIDAFISFEEYVSKYHNTEYIEINLTGKDILTLMARELDMGSGHHKGVLLIDSMYDIIKKDTVFTQDVKEVFIYYASYHKYKGTVDYNDSLLNTYIKSGYDKSLLVNKAIYTRMTIKDIMNPDNLKDIISYDISNYGDPLYNPFKDRLYKIKKFFKWDRDSRFEFSEPYFEVLKYKR